MNAEEQAVAAVLKQYQDAANAGDPEAVAALFAPDGVLMAEFSPPSVGQDAVRQAYTGMVGAVGLDIAFDIAEVRQVAPEWAFLRSASKGTIRLKASDTDVPEANQELFIFRKVAGVWKIARYSFSTTLPASTT